MFSHYSQRTPRQLRKAKPFTLHCSLLLVVFIYAFLGGLIFNRLEAKALERQKDDLRKEKLDCASKVLGSAAISTSELDQTVAGIMKCWEAEKDERSEWGYMTAWLYGFGICTTLGYNRIAPITTRGRLFCMLYGIVGIPMTMIIIANVGQYLREFAGNWRKKIEVYRVRRRESKILEGAADKVEDASIEYVSIALLLVFSAYIALGAWLLPLLNGQLELDFINGRYYNFLCLTAMDFGQLAPYKVAFLPITFIYVCFGLAITTIAIEVGSEYMKKLHYLGQRVKSVATTKIWFGSKNLKVRDLLHAVGKKCGVDPGVIDGMDLENVVERAIAINEGREPPEDTNDEYPPQEPEPKAPSPQDSRNDSPEPPHEPSPPVSRVLSLKKAILRTSSNQTTPGGEIRTFNVDFDQFKIVAIDVTPSPVEEAIGWEEPVVVALSNEITIPSEQMPLVQSSVPIILHDDEHKNEVRLLMEDEKPKPRRSRSVSPAMESIVPKNFEQKRQLYGRNSKKLLETYQEEWDRLARLSDERHVPGLRRSPAVSQADLRKLSSQKHD